MENFWCHLKKGGLAMRAYLSSKAILNQLDEVSESHRVAAAQVVDLEP